MIHYEIPEPKLSPNFTIDDIHKIRSWNYERLKDASIEERMEDSQKRVDSVMKRLGLANIKTLTQ